MPNVYDKFVNC